MFSQQKEKKNEVFVLYYKKTVLNAYLFSEKL